MTTIGSGSTASAGYTFSSSSLTLIVDGVAGSTSAKYGVLSNFTGDTITNAGKVFGLLSGGNGVEFNDGGLITNQSGATISGSYAGIMGQTHAVTLSNQGSIVGGTAGVWLKAGGSIGNSGTIGANYDVIVSGGAGTVNNTGHINGGKLGIALQDGGFIDNGAGATISSNAGAKALYVLNAGGSVYNRGVINAGTAGTAVALAAGLNDVLGIYPGSTIIGTVNGGNSIGAAESSQLLLDSSGAAVGTVAGIGVKYVNFNDIAVEPSASWVLAGSNTIATLHDYGALTNSGSDHGIVQLETFSPIATLPSLTNASGGVITGTSFAVQGPTAIGQVVNNGLLTATSDGVTLAAGGSVNNSGTINAGYAGVMVSGAAGTVTNQGSINGSTSGVWLKAGGSIGNSGTISGNYDIIVNGGFATVNNTGHIDGGKDGVAPSDGGFVTNGAGGTIIGTQAVVITGGSGAVYNHGVINAGTGGTAVSLPSGFNDAVQFYPGATFVGTVNGGNGIGGTAVSGLNLHSGSSTGTIGGIGSKYVNFSVVDVKPGASWVLAGSNTIAPLYVEGALTNSGTAKGVLELETVSAIYPSPSLTNASGGTITGTSVAVVGTLGRALVVNDSLITASSLGVYLKQGGSVTNQSLGTIAGAYAVYIAFGSGTVVNSGRLVGSTAGLYVSGAELQDGGTVTNLSGTISGKFGVIINGGAGQVTNDATISGGAGGKAVALAAFFANGVTMSPTAKFIGTVDGGNTIGATSVSSLVLTTAASGGTLSGTLSGVGSQYIDFGNFVVTNGATWTLASGNTITSQETLTDNGTLINDGSVGTGVTLGAGANLTNASGAMISGSGSAIRDTSGFATVRNSNQITGSDYGISLTMGGVITNVQKAKITGQNQSAIYLSTGTVTNSGLLAGAPGGGAGVNLESGGTVINNLSGTISGEYGVTAEFGAATIVNYATITGGATDKAVRLASGFANEVAFTPGATFSAVVEGGNTISATAAHVSTLQLNPGTSVGTVSGIGSQYRDFGHVVIASGATWTLASANTLPVAGTLTDDGTLTNDAIVSSGVTLGAGAVLTNASAGVIDALNGEPGVSDFAGIATVTNYGLIESSATRSSVELLAGGTVINRSGTISGGNGVDIQTGAATLVNDATIVGLTGTDDAVYLEGGLLKIAPGSAIVGKVVGGNTFGPMPVLSTLELASGTAAGVTGMVNGFGSHYIYFGNIVVDSGATWTLASGGTVAAGYTLKDNGSLTNAGTVLTTVTMAGAAYLYNAKSAVIDGPQYGVFGLSALGNDGFHRVYGTVTNDGLIAASPTGTTAAISVVMDGGSVTNKADGTISAGVGVVITNYPGAVTNYGQIMGTATYGGIDLEAGGTVTNLSGTIGGGSGVQIVAAAGTVINDATILATNSHYYAVYLAKGFQDLLAIAPGSTIDGPASGGNTIGSTSISTLELTTGSAAGVVGTVAGIGSHYSDFGNFVVDPGASWVMTADTIAAGYTLTDNGTLTNTGTVLTTVTLGSGASLTNAQGGLIIAGSYGVYATAGPVTVVNDGLITTTKTAPNFTDSVRLKNGGVVTNLADGTISGSSGTAGETSAVGITGAATVTNYGQILGGTAGNGVWLFDGGTVTNLSGVISGSPSGNFAAILAAEGAATTVVNFATIAGLGGGDAVDLAAGYQNRVVIAPGAVFLGLVQGADTNTGNPGPLTSTLELAPGYYAGETGTIGGIGTQFVGFPSITVDAGAFWDFATGQTIAAGYAIADSGRLTNDSTVLSTVNVGAKGAFSNAADGVVSAEYVAVFAPGGRVNVTNDGLITAATMGSGVLLHSGAVTNLASGTISAEQAVESFGGGMMTVSNYGQITGTGTFGIGVVLSSGGTVTNWAGTIAGGVGIVSNGGGTVANFATIDGSGITSSGSVIVDSVFLAAGYRNRVAIGPGAVFSGTVDGGNTIGASVASTLELEAGTTAGAVGTINGIGSQYVRFADVTVDPGASWAIANTQTLAAGYTLTDNGTLINDGDLLTTVTLGAGGSLSNASTAAINGQAYGVLGIGAAAAVVNYGRIDAGNYAVDLKDGGSVANLGGTMFANAGIVIQGGPGTVTNTGVITTQPWAPGHYSDAVVLASGYYTNLVQVGPGARFGGPVDGGLGTVSGAPGAGRLELMAGASAGTLSGLGSQYYGFRKILIDPGASWSLKGANTVEAGVLLNVFEFATLSDAGTLTNNGEIALSGSDTVTVGGLIGAGQVGVVQGTLAVLGTVASGETITLDGKDAVLDLADPHGFAGTIAGFQSGETIDLAGVNPELVNYLNGTLSFTGGSFALPYTGAGAVVVSPSADGADIVVGDGWITDQSGDFDDPSKWVGGVVPGASTDAVIDFANLPVVTHDAGSDTVNSLTNVAGDFVMSGGTLSVTSFTNDSVMAWSGGTLNMQPGPDGTATFVNAAGATLEIEPNQIEARVGRPGTGTFTNAGSITVGLGVNFAEINAALVNTGEITVNQGYLDLDGGGSSNASLLQTTGSGVIAFDDIATGGTFTLTGGVLGGVEAAVGFGTLDASAASKVFFNDLQLEGSGAVLLGAVTAQTNAELDQGPGSDTYLSGSATFTVYGGASLSGGVESGSGLTRLFGTGSIGGAFEVDGGRTVENDGFLTWSSGDITLGAGDSGAVTQSGTLTNISGAILYVTATGGRLGVGTGGSGVFSNAGVAAFYAGSGEVDIDASVANTGYIQALSGVLSLNGGGASDAGHLIVASGAALQFGAVAGTTGGATFTLTGGGLTAGSVVISGGTVNATAASSVSMGTLQLAGSGALLLGAVNGQTSGGFSEGPDSWENASGTPFLSGSGTFLIFGGANLAGGVQSGSGLTKLFGTGVLGGAGFSLDGGRTLENDGWLNWSSGDLTLGSGDAAAVTQAGTLTNASGATLFVTASGGQIEDAAGGMVNNAGVIAVYAGAGEVDIDAPVNNTGYIQALSGVLGLDGGGSSDAGHLIEAAGATLSFGGSGTFTVTGGFYNLAVTTVFNDETLDLSASSGASFGTVMGLYAGGTLALGNLFTEANDFVLDGGMVRSNGILVVNGALSAAGGVLSGSGTTVLEAGGAITGEVQLDGGMTMQNGGTLAWLSGPILLGAGDASAATQAGTLNNVAGGVFEIEADGTISSPGSGVVYNAGTLAKLGGLGVTAVNSAMNNTGTIIAASGTLMFGQAVTGAGEFMLDGTATLDLVNGTGSGSTMAFLHPGGTLETQALGSFASTISGFAVGDVIDAAEVVDVTATTTVGFNAGTLTVTQGAQSASFVLSGSYATNGFHIIGADANGGTEIGYT